MHSPGYNIYIAGLSGTGKATTVKKMLEQISSDCPPLKDYAYVNNFKDEDRPCLLIFPSGKAREFKQSFSSAINILRKRIPQALENESYLHRKKQIIELYSQKEQALLEPFNEKLKNDHFTLGQTKIGEAARPDIIPIINEKPVPIYQLDELVQQNKISNDEVKNIIKKYNDYQEELHSIFKKGLKISQQFQEQLFKLEKEAAQVVVKGVIENLREKFSQEKVSYYLDQVE